MVKKWKFPAVMMVTLIMAVSFKGEFIYFLLGFEGMILIASIIVTFYLSRKVRMKVVLPQTRVFQGETFPIEVVVTNTCSFPIPQLQIRVAVRAFPEREEMLLKGKIMLGSKETGKLVFQMDSTHVGCLEIRGQQLLLTDLLGIWQRKCKVSESEMGMLFILPKLEEETPLSAHSGNSLRMEEGEDEEKGISQIDPAEIRDYREGDPLKMVHWKLTARWERLMVREMMDQAERLTWVYVNLQEKEDQEDRKKKTKKKRDPESWDVFVKTVARVCTSLLRMEKKHLVTWIDEINAQMVRYYVNNEESLQEMLCGLLHADTFRPQDYSALLKEIRSDETTETCLEIDLQGHIVRSERT